MIERKFVKENLREVLVEEFISETLRNVGLSKVRLQRTPLGEKILIYASRPGLVVGRKGENIKKLTQVLKKRFDLENPQIELAETGSVNLDARIVAERIASTLERFGIQRFKAVGHKTMQEVMAAGARGIEILLSGKIPSARAKSWRFYAGYMKKSGQQAIVGVRHATTFATLKSGVVGVQVSIMPPEMPLPDDISVIAIHTESAKPAVEEKTKRKSVRRKKTEEGAESAAAPAAEGEAKPKKRAAPRKKKTDETSAAPAAVHNASAQSTEGDDEA